MDATLRRRTQLKNFAVLLGAEPLQSTQEAAKVQTQGGGGGKVKYCQRCPYLSAKGASKPDVTVTQRALVPCKDVTMPV